MMQSVATSPPYLSSDSGVETTTSKWKKSLLEYCDLWTKHATERNIESAVLFVHCVVFHNREHRLKESLRTIDDIVGELMKREVVSPNNAAVLCEMAIVTQLTDERKPEWLQRAIRVVECYKRQLEQNRRMEVHSCSCETCHEDDGDFEAAVPFNVVELGVSKRDDLDRKLLRHAFQAIGSKWVKVVRNLEGFKEGDILKARKANHGTNNPEMEYLDCFRMWKRSCPGQASLNNFAKALSKCDVYLDEIVQQCHRNDGKLFEKCYATDEANDS